MTTTPTKPRARFQIRDLLAMVVGYGMAAMFFRAFWPRIGPLPGLIVPAFVLYAWLGLAISGPVLLWRRGPRPPSRVEPGSGVGPLTWAEWAWMTVGIYWVLLGLFVIPVRLHTFRAGDIAVFGLVPIVAALGFRRLGPESSASGSASGWTHAAAVGLLLSWPIAWGCLVYVGWWLP